MIRQALSTFLYGAFVGIVLAMGIAVSTYLFNGPGGHGWADYYRRIKRRSGNKQQL